MQLSERARGFESHTLRHVFQKATQFRLCLKLCGFLVLFAILCTHFRILRPSADILHKTSIYKAYKAGKSLRQLTFFTNCAMKQEKKLLTFS